MKRKRKSNPQLPTGRMIHCEGVVLDSKGRVKKMKIRQNELKKLKGIRNPAKTFKIYESAKHLGGHGWIWTNEIEAPSGAAAIRLHRASQRARGNVPFAGTKFKAVQLGKPGPNPKQKTVKRKTAKRRR